MRQYLVLIAVALISISALIMLSRLWGGEGAHISAVMPEETPSITVAPEVTTGPLPSPSPSRSPSPELRHATIRAVGDIMMHEAQLKAHRTGDEFNFTPAFDMITESLKSADYTIGNLEGTIGKVGRKGYTGYPTFNAPESLLDALKEAGFDMLTLANNHMLDRAFDGVKSTVNWVEEKGFDHVGANRSKAERDIPRVVEIQGIKVGFIAYTKHTNEMERFADQSAIPYCVNLFKNSDVEQDIRGLRDAGAEVIIAVTHWGDEYKRVPEESTRNLAQKLVDAGVDVIIGSHPHNVQPIAYLTSAKDGHRALVAYSLGNFIGEMSDRYADSGIILEFSFKERPRGGFEVVDPGYVPVYLWKSQKKNDARAVKTLPILAYRDTPPGGMGESTYRLMKRGYSDITELLGQDIARVLDR